MMRFGIFGSAQASTQDLGPETGQGFATIWTTPSYMADPF